MFSRIVRPTLISSRNFSTSKQNNYKVTVCGASGGIGQPLSLLLKINPLVSELKLYDIVHTPGVAADLSHIEYPAVLSAYNGQEQLRDALKGADLVVIPAGVPRKPGMTRDDLFNSNANVIKTIAQAAVEVNPKAILAIITNPVNSCVPIACEVFKKAGKLDPRRIFGVSTLDTVRANAFIGQKLGVDPREVTVPVIGGHSGVTIIPLFSRTTPKVTFSSTDELEKMTVKVQEAGTEVVKAKAGAGSATLSMAYAGAKFANAILRGLKGETTIECSYVHSDACPDVEYFATPIILGKNGIEKINPIGEVNDFEKELIKKAIPELKKNIQTGIDFVKNS